MSRPALSGPPAGTPQLHLNSDTLIDIEGLRGTAFEDHLTGAAGDNVIYGGPAGDEIIDPGGKNYLRGDDGADLIRGGTGFDDINGNTGDDTLHGGAGDDWVAGGQHNDLLLGGAGSDLVLGNLGNDTIYGEIGADTLRGGQNNDVVIGGDGDDWLSGDLGDDTVTGGAGADTFHIFGQAGLDLVTDFNAGGLIEPIDWTEAHTPYTQDTRDEDSSDECTVLLKVEGGEFSTVAPPETPWICWSQTDLAWAEPEPTTFG